MSDIVVLARAHGGEPLKRIVVGVRNGTVHIANPDHLRAVKCGESSPIGFPERDIFTFNSIAYDILREQWDARGETDPKVWMGLVPYRH